MKSNTKSGYDNIISEPIPSRRMRAPDVRPILDIHRGKDGFIMFAVRENGTLDNWRGVPVEKLGAMFPQFADQLVQDSYFSINSFSRPLRRGNYVRWLNAAFVDVDCHQDSDELGARAGAVLAKANSGEIPKPSYLVWSGRGFWLLWLLVGSDGLPPTGISLNRFYYDQIERELVKRCNADPASKDIPRVMRVPGSLNTTAGKYVCFERLVGQDWNGRVYTYTLEEMGELLGLAPPQFKPGVKGETRNPKFRGHVAIWQHRYTAFNQLRQIRGGAFREGHRNKACYLLAATMFRLGMPKADIERDVTALAKQCRPPLKDLNARSTVASATRGRAKFREQTIMEWLQVTPGERAQIPHWRESANLSTRKAKPSERHQLIVGIIDENGGFVPAVRTAQRALAARGVAACFETIRKDYLRLNVSWEPSRDTNGTSQLFPELPEK